MTANQRSGRTWWIWGSAGAAMAVLAVVTVVALRPDTNPDGNRARYLAVKSFGPLSKTWEAPAGVVSPTAVVAGDVVASVECETLTVIAAKKRCELRGRDPASGQLRWSSDERVSYQTILEAVGGMVVVHNGLSNEGSASLILDPATGGVTKRVPRARLVAFSGRTAVFADWGRRHHVAIEPASGKQVWEATETSALDLTSFQDLMPPGTEHRYETDVPSRWVTLPGNSEAPIMEIDTGVRAGVVETVRSASANVVGDKILVQDLLARTIKMFDLTALRRASWSARLLGNEFAAPCGGMVCVFDNDKPAGKVIEPSTGRVLAHHDDRLLFGQRVGSNVVVLECSGRTSRSHPCPVDDARWRLLSRADGAELRNGEGKPVFVGIPRAGAEDAVIAEAEPGTNLTRLTYIPADPASVLRSATIATSGLARVPIDPSGRIQGQFVPDLRCVLAGPHLVCLPNQTAGSPTGWRNPV